MDKPKTKWNSLLIQHQYNSARGFNSHSDYEKFMFYQNLDVRCQNWPNSMSFRSTSKGYFCPQDDRLPVYGAKIVL